MIAFGGVAEHDVQDDLDAGLVEGFDHVAELSGWLARAPIDTVAAMGGKESDRVVAPVVGDAGACGLAGRGRDVILNVLLIELLDRKQLDGGDPEGAQVGDLVDEAGKGAGVRYAGGRVSRESADVHLIDHGLVERSVERCIAFPVIAGWVHDDALDCAGDVSAGSLCVLATPVVAIDHLSCVGVEEYLVPVEAVALLWGVGAVHAIGIDLARL